MLDLAWLEETLIKNSKSKFIFRKPTNSLLLLLEVVEISLNYILFCNTYRENERCTRIFRSNVPSLSLFLSLSRYCCWSNRGCNELLKWKMKNKQVIKINDDLMVNLPTIPHHLFYKIVSLIIYFKLNFKLIGNNMDSKSLGPFHWPRPYHAGNKRATRGTMLDVSVLFKAVY